MRARAQQLQFAFFKVSCEVKLGHWRLSFRAKVQSKRFLYKFHRLPNPVGSDWLTEGDMIQKDLYIASLSEAQAKFWNTRHLTRRQVWLKRPSRMLNIEHPCEIKMSMVSFGLSYEAWAVSDRCRPLTIVLCRSIYTASKSFHPRPSRLPCSGFTELKLITQLPLWPVLYNKSRSSLDLFV